MQTQVSVYFDLILNNIGQTARNASTASPPVPRGHSTERRPSSAECAPGTVLSAEIWECCPC